jgi:hypothetical protein
MIYNKIFTVVKKIVVFADKKVKCKAKTNIHKKKLEVLQNKTGDFKNMAASSTLMVAKVSGKRVAHNKFSFKKKISFKTSSASHRMIIEKAEYSKKAKVKSKKREAK